MQQRAGLLYLAKSTARILLIYEDQKWTVPTFPRSKTLLDDVEEVLFEFKQGKIVPIELYLSQDKGFEFGTYICLLDDEFLPNSGRTVCWANLNNLPKNLHSGLKNTLNNNLIRVKIETIMELNHVGEYRKK